MASAPALPMGLPPPVVIVETGGFDGWREEYTSARVTYWIAESPFSSLTGPARAKAGYSNGLHMDTTVDEAFRSSDHLLTDERLARCGYLGNSMGGYLAALTAASDGRVAACCVTGGTIRPGPRSSIDILVSREVALLLASRIRQGTLRARRFLLTPELLGQVALAHSWFYTGHGTRCSS